jgi:hypothetical protein
MVMGSDKGVEWGLQALTVPSDEEDTIARDKSGTDLDMVDGEAIQAHLILVA